MSNVSEPSSALRDLVAKFGEKDRTFVSTRWSVVLKAAGADTELARDALSTLCQTYWQPLYAYVRRRGHAKAESEDLVQGFFAAFLADDSLVGLDRERGRFRAFLLASIKHYMANEWIRSHRKKRGGHATHLSLDWNDAELRCVVHGGGSPDQVFDRNWAMTLLNRVLERLGEEMEEKGNGALFEGLKCYLTVGQEDVSYENVVKALGMTEAAARVAVHRLRKRYRALVREEIAGTLSDPGLVEEEMRSLFAALS